MLAITFIHLVLAALALPLASASPFTVTAFQPSQVASSKPCATHITLTTTTAAATTPTTHPRPRDDGGFAVSSLLPASTTASAATTLQQAPKAQTTEAPPADNAVADAELAQEGYSQATYYSCEKYAATTMCGWHVPVLRVESGARGGRGAGTVVIVALGCAAAVGGWLW